MPYDNLSKGVSNNIMPYIAHVAEGRLPLLNVFGNAYPTVDGTGDRDIRVMDLAEGHLAVLQCLQSEAGLHVYSLGSGRGRNLLEVVRAFEVASGRRVPLQSVDSLCGH